MQVIVCGLWVEAFGFGEECAQPRFANQAFFSCCSSYHASLMEGERLFGVSIDSELDERIVDLNGTSATLNLSEITNGGSKTSELSLSRPWC